MRVRMTLSLLAIGLLPLPVSSQVSEPQPVFTRPTLEREQLQETIESKKRGEAERRRDLPDAERRKLDKQLKLQRLQQRNLQERQRLEQQALQRRLRSVPRATPEARQRGQAQRFEREAQQLQLRQKIQRNTGRSRGTRSPGSSKVPGFSRPPTSGFPRPRLQVR